MKRCIISAQNCPGNTGMTLVQVVKTDNEACSSCRSTDLFGLDIVAKLAQHVASGVIVTHNKHTAILAVCLAHTYLLGCIPNHLGKMSCTWKSNGKP